MQSNIHRNTVIFFKHLIIIQFKMGLFFSQRETINSHGTFVDMSYNSILDFFDTIYAL